MIIKYNSIKRLFMELVVAGYVSLYYFEEDFHFIWWLFLFAWLFVFVITIGKKGFRIRIKGGLFYPILIMTFFSLFTLPFTENQANSLAMLKEVWIVAFYSITVILSIEREEVVNVWHALFVGGVIAAIYQLIHIDWSILSGNASYLYRFTLSSRLFVNTFAYQLVISFFAGYRVFIHYKQSEERIKYILSLLGMILILIGTFFTGSRKVLIAIPLFLIIALAMGKKNFGKIIVAFVAMLFIYQLLINVSVLYNSVGWRLETLGVGSTDESSIERMQLMRDAFNAGINNPLGVGLDGSKYYSTGREVYAHSNYLELFADFGWFGFIAFFSMYIYILWQMLHYKNSNKALSNFYIAIFITMMFIELTQVVYYNFVYHLCLMIFLYYSRNISTHRRRKYNGSCNNYSV